MANQTTTEEKKQRAYSVYSIKANKKLYAVYMQMIYRCFLPYHKAYKNYGGRGINVCSEWSNNWEAFAEWAISNGYKQGAGLVLDRIKNDKDYSPENCQWVSMAESCRNKRTTINVEINGVTKCLSQWAEEFSIPLPTIYARYHRGTWPLPDETTY